LSEFKYSTKKSDRVLGDEWKNWDGNSGDSSINEKKSTFFLFSFFVIILLIGFIYFSLYLITPRLELLNINLFIIVFLLALTLSIMLLIWYILLVFTVATNRRITLARRFNKKVLTFLLGKTTSLGEKFGISRDRMANSFLKVFNIITEKDSRTKLPLKPLIILPRCLKKDLKEKTSELSKKYNLEYFVVGGGQAALAKVKDNSPEAIIGVACERDLLAGIKEVSSNIPVIGIANQRPNGPCKETNLDIEELEKAIKYFMQI